MICVLLVLRTSENLLEDISQYCGIDLPTALSILDNRITQPKGNKYLGLHVNGVWGISDVKRCYVPFSRVAYKQTNRLCNLATAQYRLFHCMITFEENFGSAFAENLWAMSSTHLRFIFSGSTAVGISPFGSSRHLLPFD